MFFSYIKEVSTYHFFLNAYANLKLGFKFWLGV